MFYDFKKLGEILRDIRKNRNITPYEVRTDINFNCTTLKKIEEGGNHYLSINTFIMLCRYYGVDPIKILNDVIFKN